MEILNRKAHHDYFIDETYECGIVLTGTDLSAGRVVGLTAALSGVLLQKVDYENKMFTGLPEITWWWTYIWSDSYVLQLKRKQWSANLWTEYRI